MYSKSLRILLLTAAICVMAGSAFAQSSIEQIGNNGQVDWVKQVVSAKGIGAAPADATNMAQARAMAQRAAVVVARRNLLETIKGIHLNSVSTVENFMVTNDLVVSKVQGVLQGSSVGDYEYFSDGSVEVTVSIPLGGQISSVLYPLAAPAPQRLAAMPDSAIAARVSALEQRVSALEATVSGLKKVSFEQKEMLRLFIEAAASWQQYTMPMTVAVSNKDMIKLQTKVNTQGRQIQEILKRLDSLSTQMGSQPKAAPAKIATKTAPYTGLVIDASGIGFKPSLKPAVYVGSELVYPGDGVDMTTAVRKGYVRYYRKVEQAQRSAKVGKLPLTIKAGSLLNNNRDINIAQQAEILKAVMKQPGNFLDSCNVVIVF